MSQSYEEQIALRIQQDKAAAEFVKLVTDLWLDKSIEITLFRKPLIDQSISEILNIHEYGRQIKDEPITITETLGLLRTISQVDAAPARIDVGRLGAEWLKEGSQFDSMEAFVHAKLDHMIDRANDLVPKDVVLYGFGRIGRLLARILVAKEGRGEQLRLRAIVTRDKTPEQLMKRASLLRQDSVHGHFPGTVEVDVENNRMIVNGRPIQIISANGPEEIDYTKYDIDNALIIDNTGAFRDEEALSRHLTSKGADKVLLTAPGKGVPNIVHGVNQEDFDPANTRIWSAASCTTNAITPVLKVIEDAYGIVKGHIETVHAYTNDQNLVDNMHKKYRRGRAAAMNMVITETGAGKAVSKALPVLEGKLTSNAIRVPTPNGSLAILSLNVEKATDKEDVNLTMRKAALYSDLVEQIEYSMDDELVSSDIVGRAQPSIFDSPATIVSGDGHSMNLYVWYDNEYGYSCQVVRLAKYISNVRRLRYY
ncbi:glyceraldehyde-3-phosphate dehydrogenase [Cryomorphaceae bacterium]|nr:glyceraldehyde-3-phosphate dehydrogenase [Cryomorphaceae bacterium]